MSVAGAAFEQTGFYSQDAVTNEELLELRQISPLRQTHGRAWGRYARLHTSLSGVQTAFRFRRQSLVCRGRRPRALLAATYGQNRLGPCVQVCMSSAH